MVTTREVPGKAPRSPGIGTLTCPACAPGSPWPCLGADPSPARQQDFNHNEIYYLRPPASLSLRPLPAPRRRRTLRGVRGPRGAAAGPRHPLPRRTGALGRCSAQPRDQGTRGGDGARQAHSVRYSPARRRSGCVELLAARYRREKRKKTKRNERKRKKTKQKNKRCTVALSTQSSHRRGPGLPVRPDPAGPGSRGPAGPDPASAAERAFTRARALRTGCGERGWAADWPAAGESARALAEGTGAARGCGAGWLHVRRTTTFRPERRGYRPLQEERGAAEANLRAAS
ncbi:putative uncharacterized protein C1orf229 [Caloenas nicobarica]|uniref:putative uncharacterized protein C1orf229 n=1 Tax=Caloenas nicobarica TaxID=187106 RepID=UPI0032B7D278